jgi:hypothetical protein
MALFSRMALKQEMMNYEELLGIWLLPRGNEGKESECMPGKHVMIADASWYFICFEMMDLEKTL